LIPISLLIYFCQCGIFKKLLSERVYRILEKLSQTKYAGKQLAALAKIVKI
jgi:hypothetical protein